MADQRVIAETADDVAAELKEVRGDLVSLGNKIGSHAQKLEKRGVDLPDLEESADTLMHEGEGLLEHALSTIREMERTVQELRLGRIEDPMR